MTLAQPIAFKSLLCVQAFDSLHHLVSSGDTVVPDLCLSASAINDELGRFKIWAGNIGALQRDSRSLDYRLRDASQKQERVLQVLKDLLDSLQECSSIISGGRPQLPNSPGEES